VTGSEAGISRGRVDTGTWGCPPGARFLSSGHSSGHGTDIQLLQRSFWQAEKCGLHLLDLTKDKDPVT